MNMELSDQQAVAATLKDRHAFSHLVRKYDSALLRYILRLSGLDPDTAKDILQETFIKTYVNLNDYNVSLPFSSWIYRIAHNETMMHFRRQKSRPIAVDSDRYNMLFELIPDELDIAKEIDTKREGARIARAISTLKPEYRDAILLRFFEGKSYDEISDILEIPSGTVATNIARGKKGLAIILTQEHITDVYYENHG